MSKALQAGLPQQVIARTAEARARDMPHAKSFRRNERLSIPLKKPLQRAETRTAAAGFQAQKTTIPARPQGLRRVSVTNSLKQLKNRIKEATSADRCGNRSRGFRSQLRTNLRCLGTSDGRRCALSAAYPPRRRAF